MNLLHHNHCKLPTCFGHLSWASLGEVFFCSILQRQPSQCIVIKY